MENAAILTTHAVSERPFTRNALKLRLGHASKTPGERRNEDFFGIVTPKAKVARTKGVLLAIADGVSEGGGGRIAAETTVRNLLADYYATPESLDVPLALDKVLNPINSWLIAESGHRPDLEGMVTTISALVLRGNHYYLAHAGDTRIYRMRDGTLEQLTTDHVWPKSTMHHVLRRAVGLDVHLVIDFAEGTVEPGDEFLLLSDGIWEVLGNWKVYQLVSHPGDPQAVAQALVDEAVTTQKQYLGRNDATAVVVRVDACPK